MGYGKSKRWSQTRNTRKRKVLTIDYKEWKYIFTLDKGLEKIVWIEQQKINYRTVDEPKYSYSYQITTNNKISYYLQVGKKEIENNNKVIVGVNNSEYTLPGIFLISVNKKDIKKYIKKLFK